MKATVLLAVVACVCAHSLPPREVEETTAHVQTGASFAPQREVQYFSDLSRRQLKLGHWYHRWGDDFDVTDDEWRALTQAQQTEFRLISTPEDAWDLHKEPVFANVEAERINAPAQLIKAHHKKPVDMSHLDFTSNISGAKLQVGKWFHRRGQNYDITDVEYQRLTPEHQKTFFAINKAQQVAALSSFVKNIATTADPNLEVPMVDFSSDLSGTPLQIGRWYHKVNANFDINEIEYESLTAPERAKYRLVKTSEDARQLSTLVLKATGTNKPAAALTMTAAPHTTMPETETPTAAESAARVAPAAAPNAVAVPQPQQTSPKLAPEQAPQITTAAPEPKPAPQEQAPQAAKVTSNPITVQEQAPQAAKVVPNPQVIEQAQAPQVTTAVPNPQPTTSEQDVTTGTVIPDFTKPSIDAGNVIEFRSDLSGNQLEVGKWYHNSESSKDLTDGEFKALSPADQVGYEPVTTIEQVHELHNQMLKQQGIADESAPSDTVTPIGSVPVPPAPAAVPQAEPAHVEAPALPSGPATRHESMFKRVADSSVISQSQWINLPADKRAGYVRVSQSGQFPDNKARRVAPASTDALVPQQAEGKQEHANWAPSHLRQLSNQASKAGANQVARAKARTP